RREPLHFPPLHLIVGSPLLSRWRPGQRGVGSVISAGGVRSLADKNSAAKWWRTFYPNAEAIVFARRTLKCNCAPGLSRNKSGSVHRFSSTILVRALATMLWRLNTTNAVGAGSTNRCKRYQLVAGMRRNSSTVFNTRS